MYGTRYSCQVLSKLEFSRQIFEKQPNLKFHENTSSGSPVVPCGQTDKVRERHDKANSRFSQFCKPAQKSSYLSHNTVSSVQLDTTRDSLSLCNRR